jgi:hypothetical protein
MSYHMDREVNAALIRLLDSLCMHERESGRRSTLILIPHNKTEDIILAQDGKPLQHVGSHKSKDAHLIFALAMKEREEETTGK